MSNEFKALVSSVFGALVFCCLTFFAKGGAISIFLGGIYGAVVFGLGRWYGWRNFSFPRRAPTFLRFLIALIPVTPILFISALREVDVSNAPSTAAILGLLLAVASLILGHALGVCSVENSHPKADDEV